MEPITTWSIATIATIIATKGLEKSGEKLGEGVMKLGSHLLGLLKQKAPETATAIARSQPFPLSGQLRWRSTSARGAYHQGTVWGWLIGPFVLAHLRVYSDPVKARQFLEPMANQFYTHGIGTLSEIFDSDAPMKPNGCIAQAWTIAEVLRAWLATEVERS